MEQSAENPSERMIVISKLNFGLMVLAILSMQALVAVGAYFLAANSQPNEVIVEDTPPTAVSTPTPIATITSEPTTSIALTPTTPGLTSRYIVPSNWTRVSMINDELKLCLPPKWEADQFGNIYFNRDSGYRPNVTYIQSIPVSGSRRESYFKYWQTEYPSVKDLVTISELQINDETALLVKPKGESKTSPEGMTLVWQAGNKIWKAPIGNWNMVSDSHSAFLKEFYTAVSCSF